MLASLLFSGVATTCQHNVATIPAQEYAGNAFNTSAAPSPDTKDRKSRLGKDEVIDTREYQVKDFDHIDCGTIANIYFTQGNETRVVAKLHHESLDLLEVSTHNGCLKLRTADLGLPTKRFSIGKRNRAYVGDLDGKAQRAAGGGPLHHRSIAAQTRDVGGMHIQCRTPQRAETDIVMAGESTR